MMLIHELLEEMTLELDGHFGTPLLVGEAIIRGFPMKVNPLWKIIF